MWELDSKESWVPKNWCFWTVVLEKTLESPLERREIQPVHSKGNQSWIFIGRTDAEAETPILWPPDELTHLKRSWCWKRLKEGGEGDDIGWDGWMASLTRWTWVWENSGRWWRTGKPGMLQSTGSHSWTRLSDWTTTKKAAWKKTCSWDKRDQRSCKCIWVPPEVETQPARLWVWLSVKMASDETKWVWVQVSSKYPEQPTWTWRTIFWYHSQKPTNSSVQLSQLNRNEDGRTRVVTMEGHSEGLEVTLKTSSF